MAVRSALVVVHCHPAHVKVLVGNDGPAATGMHHARHAAPSSYANSMPARCIPASRRHLFGLNVDQDHRAAVLIAPCLKSLERTLRDHAVHLIPEDDVSLLFVGGLTTVPRQERALRGIPFQLSLQRSDRWDLQISRNLTIDLRSEI